LKGPALKRRRAVAALALVVGAPGGALAAGGEGRDAHAPAREAVAYLQVTGRRELCSATLVAPRALLTARHCVQRPGAEAPREPAELRLGFGEDAFGDEPEAVVVEQVLVPAGARYEKTEDLLGNDLAVLVLREPSRRAPIVAAPRRDRPLQAATLIGFGEDRYGRVGRRHATPVAITGRDALTVTFAGAGCGGDSGGALVDDRGALVALVSLGTRRHCTGPALRYGQRLDALRGFVDAALAEHAAEESPLGWEDTPSHAGNKVSSSARAAHAGLGGPKCRFDSELRHGRGPARIPLTARPDAGEDVVPRAPGRPARWPVRAGQDPL
jgi:trypsin